MNPYAASALVNFITTFLLGVIVLIRNPRSRLNLIFFAFSLDVSLWSFCYYLWQISVTENQALFWSKALMVFAIFIPVLYLHFVFVLLKIAKSKTFFLGSTYFLFSLFLLADIFTSFFITSVRPILTFKYWPTAGPLFYLFLALWVGYMLWNAYYLYSIQRNSSGLLKLQIKYVFLGFIIGLAGGVTNYFMWFGVPIPPAGNILVSVYVALNAYAIVKHRFFDIRLVLARTITYMLLLIIFGAFYTGSMFWISNFFFAGGVSSNQVLIYALLALFIAFTFQPLKRLLEKLTDAIFYKGHYDSNQLLSRLGSIMSTNIELESLSAQIIQTLIEQMRISKGAFVIFGAEQTTIYDIIDIGFSHKLSVSFNQMSVFLPFPQIIIFDELEENSLKNLMREMDISVVKTLKVKGAVVGLLLLGGKGSGEIYSEQDLKVLEILAPEVAVAIQNSQSYDKIKKFNVILSQEVKKATTDLQSANQRLREVDQLKDDFVSIASHELRTPMTAIRSYAWMMLHRSDVPLSKTLEKYVARILLSTERLINLVNDMLNVSRIESGRVEINPEPVDVLSLVKDIIDELYYSKSEEKHVEFVVLERPVPKVFADPEKLRQVFLNLVGNALKFTPAGGKITFDLFTDGKVVETSVSDSGVGMSKEDLSKLFSKFGRLDNSYTAAATSGGTGLGLYISKNLVELMHGKIWANSEGLNKGSTFTVSLPIATAETLKNIEVYRVKPKGEAKGLEPVAI